MRNVKRQSRGLSLIELLVVMVILVIGIFTVARIFPQGFRFIEHSRNVTFAGRLAQAEVERWKTYQSNVPDGIEAESPDQEGVIVTDYNPNDMRSADPNATNPRQVAEGENPWYWSNVNRARRIKGETTRIPTATLLPYGAGGNYAYSIYNLKFAPIDLHHEEGESLPPGYEWPDEHVLIYGDDLPRTDVTGLSGDERGEQLDRFDRVGYAMDYEKGSIFFRPWHWTRRYRVEFAYWDGNTLKNGMQLIRVQSSADWGEPLPTDAIEVPLEVRDEGGALKRVQNVDAYSDHVSRVFHYVQPGEFNQFNPYEFTFLNNYNNGSLSFAPTIGFNPIGQNRNVRTNLGTRPLTAHIEYETVDWHIIREDRTVPTNRAVRLTLPGVKVAGRRYSDINVVGNVTGTVNSPVYDGITQGLRGYSVVALDLTDNTLMTDGNGAGTLKVDYRNGIVRFPPGLIKYTPFGNPIQESGDNDVISGHDIRIFYQATGDWGVQVSKAWAAYQRRDVGAGNNNWRNLQYNQFDVQIVEPNGSAQGHPYNNPDNRYKALLTFPRSNAGQSVAVSFLWTDVNNATRQVTGQQYKLPEFGTIGAGYPYIVVPIGRDFRAPANGEEWKNPNFTFVQGASLKVRTIWRENPRRWESRDVETFINRK